MENYNLKLGLILFILITTLLSVQAQSTTPAVKEFKYSGQSKSGFFKSGESASFKLNAFGGFEYKIHIIAEEKFGAVFFRIKESDDVVLYDSQEENVLDKQFIIEDSKILLLEVVVPESENGTIEKGGIGVTIEYRKVE